MQYSQYKVMLIVESSLRTLLLCVADEDLVEGLRGNSSDAVRKISTVFKP